jgi:hypothetical protein
MKESIAKKYLRFKNFTSSPQLALPDLSRSRFLFS